MSKFVRIFISLVILAAGILVLGLMIKTRPKAKRGTVERPVPLVEIIRIEPGNHQVVVEAMGTVVPAQQVILQPQVSGRVIEQHTRLVPGGCFTTGNVVARIDPRDYELAIIQQKANVEKARFELEMEEGRQRVAQREWDLLESSSDANKTDHDLALRKPHLRAAKAALEAAQSRLDQAELNMERTVITAPFNSFVKEEYIDVGQLVSPQSRIATLVGTDQFWVQVALPVERLSWITVPRNEQTEGSRAVVLQSTGSGIDISRMGRVTRLIGELDPVGRMARLLVSVDDPLGLFNNRKKKDLPLILGAYVNVELEGTMLRNIFAVPRLAIHNLDRVWLLDMDNCLAMKKVSIVWRNEDTVFISDGLKSGDRVITSSLPTPIPGMELNQVEAKN